MFSPRRVLPGLFAHRVRRALENAGFRVEAGEVTGIRTTTSLVWRRGADGWRIVREHYSTNVIPVDQVESADADDAAW